MTEKNVPSIISKISKYIDMRTKVLIGSIIALSVALAFATPYFLTTLNFQILILSMSVLSILAMGELLVIAGGEIDISLESLINFVSISTLLPIFWLHVDWYIAIPLALLAGAGWGAVNGFITVKFKIPSFLTTLATLILIQGFAYIMTEYRSWSLPRGVIDQIFANKIIGIIDTGVLWMIGIVIVTYIILNRTRFGRRVYACGGNRDGSEMIGVPVKKTKFWLFVIMGVLVTFATLITMSRAKYASHQIGYGYLMPTIGAPVLGGALLTGGTGSVPKTFLGSFLFTLIINGSALIGLEPAHTYILLGSFLLLVLSVERLRGIRVIPSLRRLRSLTSS